MILTYHSLTIDCMMSLFYTFYVYCNMRKHGNRFTQKVVT